MTGNELTRLVESISRQTGWTYELADRFITECAEAGVDNRDDIYDLACGDYGTIDDWDAAISKLLSELADA